MPEQTNGMGAVAPYKDRDRWLEEWRKGLGGSDAAAIAGLDPYRTEQDVWDDKVLGPDPLDNADIRRGIKQEPIAAERLIEETGWQIRRQPLRRHPDHPWLLCDIDRQILGHERGPGLVEVKVPRVASFYQIKEQGLPEQYIVQLHHNMLVWGYEWSAFAVYTPEYDELVHFPVARDEELADWLLRQEEAWWYSYVQTRKRPPRRPPPELPAIRAVPGEATVRTDREWLEAAAALAKADGDLGWAKGNYEAAKARLVELASGGDEAKPLYVVGGGVQVKRYWCDGRVSWKTTCQRVAKAAGVDVQEHQEVGDPYARTEVRVTVPEEALASEEAA